MRRPLLRHVAPAVTLLALTVACNRREPHRLEATGTIEVRETDVAPTVPARVVRMLVDEGAPVRRGDTLAILTTPTLGADIAQRRSRVAQSEATLRELEEGPRAAEIARASAELRAAEAEAVRTQRDLERATELASHDVISRQQLDAASAAAHSATARRDAARDALRLLQQGTRPERVEAGRAEVANARATLAAAEATARDLVLTSPVSGVVLGRHAEPGEVIPAGTPTVTVGETTRPWVRVYIGGPQLPLVRVGASATATLDGFPDRPFAGRVVAINDRAEYTPRVALTEEERADLMFGVKVELSDTTGTLKPGLPVTVRITTAPAGVAAREPRG